MKTQIVISSILLLSSTTLSAGEIPLSQLPSVPGPHINTIKNLSDNTWLDLGRPQADLQWGNPRGRAWSASMTYCPEKKCAFLYGEGVHGWHNPATGNYMDDFWAYDLNAHRWICLYPGSNPGTLQMKINSDGIEVTMDGNAQPVASCTHMYEMMTYNPDKMEISVMPNTTSFWKPYLGDVRNTWLQPAIANSSKSQWFCETLNWYPKKTGPQYEGVSPWMYSIATGKWKRHATMTASPMSTFGSVSEYIPSQKEMFFFKNPNVWFFNYQENSWRKEQTAGPSPVLSYDIVSAYDTKRNQIYLAGGHNELTGSMFWKYDIDQKEFVQLNPTYSVPHWKKNFTVNTAKLIYDQVNDVLLLFHYNCPDEYKGVFVYDIEKNLWEKTSDLPENFKTTNNGYYDNTYNICVFNSAGDSKDDGIIFVYRYKKAGQKGYFPWSLMLASHGPGKDPCKEITCSNHGTCTSVAGKASCTCENGYLPDSTGLNCFLNEGTTTAGVVDVWTHVWCPDTLNGGTNFSRVASLNDLPVDPIGDGEHNCYMEAFDTSVFSSDGQPVRGCVNLDLDKFPEHDCVEIHNGAEFKSVLQNAGISQNSGKIVAIIVNDIVVGPSPFIAGHQEDVWLIGVYDPETKRPVLITQEDGQSGTLLSWSPHTPTWNLTAINLRMHTQGMCFGTGMKKTTGTVTLQSVTGKCRGRLMIASFESPNEWNTRPDPISSIEDLTPWDSDDRIYMRNVMARARNSHSVYLDRTYLNWVEDSIIMASFGGGKHAAKFEGQNVYARNSIFTNTGIHNQPIVDPEYGDIPRHGNLAPLSLAAFSRVVLDHLTLYSHYARGESNARSIQWQIRDAIGAASDMPWAYYPNMYPAPPYHGPAYYLGQYYQHTPFWDENFWTGINENDPMHDPGMVTSYVTSIHLHQTAEAGFNINYLYAMGSVGTYPTTRNDQGSATNFHAPSEVPASWKERQRVIVNNNCLDDGLPATNIYQSQ